METKIRTEKRAVYFIQPTCKSFDGEFIPCIAVEGESGYHKTDWTWGKDIKIAEQCAKEKNESLGFTEKDAMRIVLGTMRPL